MATKAPMKTIVIEGVVKTAWDDALDVFPWRIQGGTLESLMLRVNLSMGKVPAKNAVVRITATKLARVKDPEITFQWTCSGARPLKVIKDDELGAVADAREKPLFYKNRIFGTMELDREYDWYLGQRTHGGQAYDIIIDVTDPDNARRSAKELTAGAAAILAAESKLPAITKSVIEKMLPLYLKVWREGGRKYTATDFARMIELATIHVQGDRTTLRYRSGSLFGDHGIEARLKGGKIRECHVA